MSLRSSSARFMKMIGYISHGYMESCNGKMRDELLHRELMGTLWKAKTLCGH